MMILGSHNVRMRRSCEIEIPTRNCSRVWFKTIRNIEPLDQLEKNSCPNCRNLSPIPEIPVQIWKSSSYPYIPEDAPEETDRSRKSLPTQSFFSPGWIRPTDLTLPSYLDGTAASPPPSPKARRPLSPYSRPAPPPTACVGSAGRLSPLRYSHGRSSPTPSDRDRRFLHSIAPLPLAAAAAAAAASPAHRSQNSPPGFGAGGGATDPPPRARRGLWDRLLGCLGAGRTAGDECAAARAGVASALPGGDRPGPSCPSHSGRQANQSAVEAACG